MTTENKKTLDFVWLTKGGRKGSMGFEGMTFSRAMKQWLGVGDRRDDTVSLVITESEK